MKIVFMGTPQAAVPSLARCLSDAHEVVAVYTQPDRPSGRGNKITFSPVKVFALANGLPIYQPLKIKVPETFDLFVSHSADLAVVAAYGRILPESYLTAYPKGAVNVHFSLLPKYRGAAPVNWAIVNGEAETGVTTMQMDSGLDTGAILMQRAIPIAEDETAIDLMSRLSFLGADLLSETLASFSTLIATAQDHMSATFAPIMKREDGLIDWRMPATQIANRVRGFQPFPATFTYFRKTKLTIWAASKLSEFVGAGTTPGEIIEAHGDDFYIYCGGGSVLKVVDVQPEGKRRIAVRDFINGFRPQKGEVFGV